MKEIILTSLIYFSLTSIFAQEIPISTFECQEAGCSEISGNESIDFSGGGANFVSAIIAYFQEEIFISRENKRTLLEARFSLRQGREDKLPVSINLSSDSKSYEGSRITVVGDILGDVSIVSNGHYGSQGKSSSEVCAENLLTGLYDIGYEDRPSARDYAESKYLEVLNPSCDVDDLKWLADNRFTCPPGHEIIETSIVEIGRLKEMRKCVATGISSVLTRRTVDVNCKREYLMKFYDSSKTLDRCCNSTEAITIYDIPEFFIEHPKDKGNWICDPLACREVSVKNGQSLYATGYYKEWVERVSEIEHRDNPEKSCFSDPSDDPFDSGIYYGKAEFKTGENRIYRIFQNKTPRVLNTSDLYHVISLPDDIIDPTKTYAYQVPLGVTNAEDFGLLGCFGIGAQTARGFLGTRAETVAADELASPGIKCLQRVDIDAHYLTFFPVGENGLLGKEIRIYVNQSTVDSTGVDAIKTPTVGQGWQRLGEEGSSYGYVPF